MYATARVVSSDAAVTPDGASASWEWSRMKRLDEKIEMLEWGADVSREPCFMLMLYS